MTATNRVSDLSVEVYSGGAAKNRVSALSRAEIRRRPRAGDHGWRSSHRQLRRERLTKPCPPGSAEVVISRYAARRSIAQIGVETWLQGVVGGNQLRLSQIGVEAWFSTNTNVPSSILFTQIGWRPS